jgi:hypothetical protein
MSSIREMLNIVNDSESLEELTLSELVYLLAQIDSLLIGIKYLKEPLEEKFDLVQEAIQKILNKT